MLSGNLSGTRMHGQGTFGVYWSSTAYSSAANAYYLELNNSGAVFPADYYGKFVGFSLRCLALLFRLVFSTHTIYQLLTDSTGPNLVLSGYRESTSMYYRGTEGRYWSSTAHSSATRAYYLYLDRSEAVVSPAANREKYRGFSLRCLAKVAPIQFALISHLPCSFTRKKKEKSFYTHYPNYTSMTNSAGPEFVLGGRHEGNSTNLQGTYGVYLSSTATSNKSWPYGLLLDGDGKSINPENVYYKYSSDSLRCLAEII